MIGLAVRTGSLARAEAALQVGGALFDASGGRLHIAPGVTPGEARRTPQDERED